MTKATWGEKEASHLVTYAPSGMAIQGKEPGVGNWNRPWKNSIYWLAPQYWFSLLSHIIKDHLPIGAPAHSNLGPSTQHQSLIKIKIMSFGIVYRPNYEGIFSNVVPSSQTGPACIKYTHTTHHVHTRKHTNVNTHAHTHKSKNKK